MHPIKPDASIAVIGAGIIGCSAAFVLAERGFRVTLIDRAEPGRTGPSFGNAGHSVGSGIFPLAEPGIGLMALRMLSRPDGPLKIPLGEWPRLAPWLWRFWRTSMGRAQETAIAALTDLSAGAVDANEALWTRAGIGHVLKRKPALYLYESNASFRAAHDQWQRRADAGRPVEALSAAQIREMEPAFAPVFVAGMASQPYGVVTDPFEVVSGLFYAALDRGVGFQQRAVERIDTAGFDAVLVSAGAWTPMLARTFGDRLPVEAERGYNLTFPDAPVSLNHPILLADRGIAVSQLTVGLRFGGWSELGGTELPPNPAHWTTIRGIAETLLPGLGQGAPAREWMGHRPATPDSVPILSRSPRDPKVFYAVGHGHYGLSLSGKTAGIMAELIADAADTRYAAFSLKRFG